MSRKDLLRLKLARSIDIYKADITRKQEKYAQKEQNEDTKRRRSIQEYIRAKKQEGKSREEILRRLNFVYADKRYSKYRPYFESWVDNFFKDEKTNEGEER